MQIFLKSILLIVPCLVLSQELHRRANWQATFDYQNEKLGAKVISIAANSPLALADISVGDLLLKVDGVPVSSSEKWSSIFYGLRSDKEITLLIRRSAEVFTKKVRLTALPYEKHNDYETSYDLVRSDTGIRQRTLITRPKNRKGKLPAIILIQGLSCSSVEVYPGRKGNWVHHIEHLVANSQMVVMRIEKPGVGDSDGDCSETDFLTELEGYRAAIRVLKAQEFVDAERIVIYGSSMGSALAPLLANEFDLAGIISDGTFFKTWFEHMLEIERRIRAMSGDTQATIVKKMNEAYIPLYYGMLIEQKTFQEVIAENRALTPYNYHSKRHMYGRPVTYYHQLQQFDLAGEWQKVTVPVRILYGSNDWIMTEEDHHMIMAVLDKAGHKDHKLRIYPGLDHWNTIHKTPEDSFKGEPGQWDAGVPQQIITWAKEIVHAVD